jgi:membrane fusion protein (multidrug efflux system)
VDELEAAYLGTDARLDGAKKELADRTVRAPFAGVVGIRGVDIGARVDDDDVLTTLDDLAELEIEFSVPEIFFGRVRRGQTVDATSSAFPGRAFRGEIATIDSRIGAISRAFRVRALLPNPDLELPAGMFMHVSVVLEQRPAVLVPEEAILAEGDNIYVFTVSDEQAVRRKVELGQREAGTVEVLDGVAAGEAVVSAGLQRLRDGAAIRVLNQEMLAAGQETKG